MTTKQIAITLETKTLQEFDDAIGLVKRSTMIQELISNYLEKKVKVDCSTKTTPHQSRHNKGENV